MSGVEFKVGIPLPIYIKTESQARDLLLMSLRKVNEEPGELIGFDTETTGKKLPFKIGTKDLLDWMSDTVTFWSLAFRYRGECFRFCIRGEYFQYFAPLLENPNAWFACWNAKYDAHVSWNCGVNVWNANIIDGLALVAVHDENRQTRGLKGCAKDFLGLSMTKYEDLFPNRDINGKKIKEFETSLLDLAENGLEDQVVNYASYDAYCHLLTVEWLIDKLKKTLAAADWSLWDYFLTMETHITKILWRMERRGMFINVDHLRSQIPQIDKRLLDIAKEVNQLAGKPINISSPKQLTELFFGAAMGLKPVKQTKAGKASADHEVLELLAAAGVDIASKIIEYRSLAKTKSTYLEAICRLVDYYKDGRIHPSFNQFGAQTGRFSTEAINSQNLPRADSDEFKIRKAFVAPPGKKLCILDYEQLEMRIMAHMSGDRSMIQAIQEGKDLHSFTVSRMVPNVTYDEVVAAKKTKKEELTQRQKWLLQLRQDNKAIGFGIIYGAGPPRVATQIDIPQEDVQRRIDRLLMEEANASVVDLKKGKVLSARIKRLIKDNPLLSQEKATILVARQSIASEKIQAYFDTFPGVHKYMKETPELCRQRMMFTTTFNGEPARPRERPRDKLGNPIDDGMEYDWDMGDWELGQTQPLTRTGHEKRFGFVQTLLGRYRRLEDINSSNYRYRSEAERQAVNVTIQGSAADITKGAMIRIEYHPVLRMMPAQIINQIHDELIIEVPEDRAEEALPILCECMEHPFQEGVDPLCVRLPAEGKIVDSWAEK